MWWSISSCTKVLLKQLLITDKFLCFTLFGNEGLTGRDVSWFLERLSVSSFVHWSMHSDISDIWLLLRFSRLRLASEYKHSGTRDRSLQDRSTSTQKRTNDSLYKEQQQLVDGYFTKSAVTPLDVYLLDWWGPPDSWAYYFEYAVCSLNGGSEALP